ncbi:MAG: metallophosphoesterase [Paludibacteraceae bacterium]|nr:metallophosphoesterase [Paludibacteraceae bacterium]
MKKHFLTLVLSLISVAIFAATINVSPGSGKIKSAVGNAKSGDVIVLADGEYTEPSYSDVKYSMTIKAAEGAKPIIKMGYGYFLRVRNDGTELTLNGLTIDGNGTANARSIRNYGSDGAITANQKYLVYNCTFQNMDRAFYLASNTSNCTLTVDGCNFTDVTRAIYIGSYLDAGDDYYSTTRTDINVPDLTVTNSMFVRNMRSLSVAGARRTTKNVLVQNNTFVSCGKYDATDPKKVINERTLYFSAVDGEDESYTPINCTIDHCTFYACNNTRTVYCPAYDGTIISNCICYFTEAVADGYAYAVYGANSIVKNSIAFGAPIKTSSEATTDKCSFQNPLFVDVEKGNFQLFKNSPAVATASDGTNMGDPRWGVSEKDADISKIPLEERIVKTPYSMSPTTSSVKVIWQQSDDTQLGYVRYGTSKANLNLSASSSEGKYVEGEGYVHVVTLTGLQPFTTYYYQVGDGKQWYDQVNSTKTAPNAGTAFRIFTISDIHVNSRSNWSNMQDFICTLGCDLAMCNGDFVNDGAGRDWNLAYFQPGKPFLSQTPMMSAAGNHETDDPYTYRWSTFYDYFWQFSHGDSEDPIKDPRGEGYFAYDYGNARIIAVNVNGGPAAPDFGPNSKQYKWLENELKNATAPWILIFGHVGLTTSGSHGEWPPEYRNEWRALFEKYVKLGKHIIYFCGDDHSFEHAFKDGVHYVRPACGRNSNYAQKKYLDDAKYTLLYKQISCYSTLDMSADAKTLTLTARDSASNVFYTYQFKQEGELIAPNFEFTVPNANVEAKDSIMLSWNLLDPQNDAKVAIYASTTANLTQAQLPKSPIYQFTGTSTPRFFWHTRQVDPKGTYYLYITVTSGGKTYFFASPYTVTLLEDTEAPAAPANLGGYISDNHYQLFWTNPTALQPRERQLTDFSDGVACMSENSEANTSSVLSADNGALKVEFNVSVAWAQTAAEYTFTPAADCHETPILHFRLKGDGSNTALRIIAKNDFFGHEDWWGGDEYLNLASTEWREYTIDLSKLPMFDWYTNSATANACDALKAISFAVSPASPVSGTFYLDDLYLTGMVNPAPDFDKVIIRRSTTGYPTSITAGDAVYQGKEETCLDATSDISTVYYYSAFALDDRGNVSAPAQWLSTNLTDALDSPYLPLTEGVGGCPKFIKNNHLYIRHNEKTYTILGH